MIITQYMIERWINISDNLKNIKAEEMRFRAEICNDLLEGKGEGVHKIVAFGYDIKATKKLNYKLDTGFDFEMLTEEERECIKMKPGLALAIYKKTERTDVLDEFVTVSEAAATLSIEPSGD